MIYFLILYLKRPNINIETSCPKGYCKVNLFNGNKICPITDNSTLSYDKTYEICSKKYSCPIEMPFALYADGSTNQRNCEPGVACPCLRQNQCPSYIRSAFRFIDGNPNSLGGRMIIEQFSPYSNNNAEVNGNNIITNNQNEFCSISSLLISVSTPGCSNINLNNFSIDATDIINCLQNVPGNPCLSGNLAIITNDSSSIDKTNLNNTVIGCVSSETTCSNNTLPVFDTSYGEILCL